jgi:biotin carboxyl carrier protein
MIERRRSTLIVTLVLALLSRWPGVSAVQVAAQSEAPEPGVAEASAAEPADDEQAAEAAVAFAPDALITVHRITSTPRGKALRTYGRVIAHPAATFDVNAYLSGQIGEIFARTGDLVRAGDVVAALESPDFVLTQRSYLELLANEERLSILREEGRLPNYLKDARENLRWWGMSDQEITDLTDKKKVVHRLLVRSPQDGIVTDVLVQPGQVVNAGDKTMQNFVVLGKPVVRMVATGKPLQLEIYVPADALGGVRAGSTVVELTDGRGVPAVPVTDVLSELNKESGLARAVADLGAESHHFVLGEVVPVAVRQPAQNGIWVPRSAVLRQGPEPVVFVRSAPGEFRRRVLRVTNTADGWIAVGNVAVGEDVVTGGKMILEGAYRMRGGRSSSDHH